MLKLIFSSVTLEDLESLINLQEGRVASHTWTQIDHLLLTEKEQRQLEDLQSHLLDRNTTLMNEATIWARAIYPLLVLAEQEEIETWASVPLQATYSTFALEGVADGVLGKRGLGRVTVPYLIVVEAKRGVDAQNPIYQLYSQLLAAARLNWEREGGDRQEIFGCFTVSDTWQFVKGEVSDIEAERPTLKTEYSREYDEKLEADIILKILKGIVNRYVARTQIAESLP
jgi:hypothetical protein